MTNEERAHRRAVRAALVRQAHRIEALEALVGELAQQRLGLRELWQALEKAEVRDAAHERMIAAQDRRIDALERELARNRQPRRVPAAAAARRLGLSLPSIRRLIVAGELRGAALQLPDRERRAWVVDFSDLERFERDSGAVGAPDTATEPAAGHCGSNTRGSC